MAFMCGKIRGLYWCSCIFFKVVIQAAIIMSKNILALARFYLPIIIPLYNRHKISVSRVFLSEEVIMKCMQGCQKTLK